MEEIPAVGLQVQTLTGGVRCNQDTERMFAGVGIEGLLDLLPFIGWCGAVKNLDPLLRSVCALNGGG
jgi:hypothetical protein